jgi:hypothetical protein
LTETIDEVFWIRAAEGGAFDYVSPAFERIWGRPVWEALANSAAWWEAIHPDERAAYDRSARETLGGSDFELEYRVLRPDGATRWIWDRGFAVRDEGGRVVRVVGVAVDTTELKLARDQALRAERLAAIGEAMAGLAHESRNALQRSQAGLEMLARRLQDRPESLELLVEIQRAQHYLYQLYEQVRGYAAPLNLRRAPVDLALLVRESWNDLSLAHRGQGGRLVIEPADCDASACVDPSAMGQVFRNILENSLAAVPEPEICVTFSGADLGGTPAVAAAVRDNGPGMSAEQRSRIFEPFYTTKVRGAGLGMAISRRIVEAHRGRIEAADRDGPGAEIRITLPRSPA